MLQDYDVKFASKFVPGIHKINVSFEKAIVRKIYYLHRRLEANNILQNGGKLKNKIGKQFKKMRFLINKLWESRKYYAKNDLMLLSDHLDFAMPKDKFKDMRDFTKKVVPVQDKITQIINFPGYKRPSDMTLKAKDKSNYKFTSKEVMFRTKNSIKYF